MIILNMNSDNSLCEATIKLPDLLKKNPAHNENRLVLNVGL